MKFVAILGLIGACLFLTGCGDHKIAITVTKTVVVSPDEATYAHCPQYVDVPVVVDTNTGANGVLTMYGVYKQCRQTVADIKSEIERLKAIAERDNPKN
jgi:hypothetical protein